MSKIKIEQNSPPLPPLYVSKYPLVDMEPGNSFVCDVEAGDSSHKLQERLRAAVARFIRKPGNQGRKFEVRRESDKKVRVWRID